MNNFGVKIKMLREQKNMLLRHVSSLSGIDIGLLSKIERGERTASRSMVKALSITFQVEENSLLLPYLSDKVLAEIYDEDLALDVLKLAESGVRYGNGDKKIEQLLLEIDALKKSLDKLRPFPVAQIENLNQYYKVEYTYESNRIEGNTLNHMETALVIEKGMTIDGKSMREHLEAINHSDAIDFIRDLVQNGFELDERLIKEIHHLVLRGIDKEYAGRYRNVDVRISGSKHIPPAHFKLQEMMEGLIIYFYENSSKLHPVILAAEMHHRLVSIHPFIDGNGRTSRLLMNLILLKNGYTLANLKGDIPSRMRYYDALENAHNYNESGLFHMLIATEAKRSLEEYLAIVGNRQE
jgi:Fic family protein